MTPNAPRTSKRALSRRRFLALVAASAVAPAAVLAPEAGSATATKPVTPSRRPPTAAPARALPAEIESQKKSVAGMLETIRAFRLPTGSNPAFMFAPIKAGRRRPGV